jgi:hypothetical protein
VLRIALILLRYFNNCTPSSTHTAQCGYCSLAALPWGLRSKRGLPSVLRRHRFSDIRAPDFESHAPPDVKAADGVSAFDRVVEPHLNRDWTEVVADEAADGYLRLVAA